MSIGFNIRAQEVYHEKIGDIASVAFPLSAFASTFIWKDDKKASLQFIKTMGTSLVVTHSLKRIINKQRPNGDNNLSFPSGHTSAAFTGAAFIERRYGLKAGIPAYLLASYVGWSRVYTRNHDYYDVIGSVIIGIGSAYLFTKPYQTKIELTTGKIQGIQTIGLRINL